MEIKGKVHCFFEQSGTFKNEFEKYRYGKTYNINLDFIDELDRFFEKKKFDRVASFEKFAMINCDKGTYMDVMTNQIQQLFKEKE